MKKLIPLILILVLIGLSCAKPPNRVLDMTDCEYTPRAFKIKDIVFDTWLCPGAVLVMRPSIPQPEPEWSI